MRLDFVSAHEPVEPASPHAWCFGFVQGDLLLPEGDAVGLQPLAAAVFLQAGHGPSLPGRLAGVDCWALGLPQPPAGWRRSGCAPA
jgi:hypothetical protein